MITDIPCVSCQTPVRVRYDDASPPPFDILCVACAASAARRSERNRRDAVRQAYYRALMDRLDAAGWLLANLRRRIAQDRARDRADRADRVPLEDGQ